MKLSAIDILYAMQREDPHFRIGANMMDETPRNLLQRVADKLNEQVESDAITIGEQRVVVIHAPVEVAFD